ncbi:MAG: hypothetical protein ACE364_07430 [Chlorobiota bacterium]
MIRIGLLITIISIMSFSCNENNDLKEVNGSKLNLISFDKERKIFIENFLSISDTNNHYKENDIEFIISGLRRNYLHFYINKRITDIWDISYVEFYNLKIYDYSIEAKSDNYGYIILLNELIINKSKWGTYYIYWHNNSFRTDNHRARDIRPFIYDNTNWIISNLDSSQIKKVFKTNAKFYKKKANSIMLEFDSLNVDYDSLTNNIKISNYPA